MAQCIQSLIYAKHIKKDTRATGNSSIHPKTTRQLSLEI